MLPSDARILPLHKEEANPQPHQQCRTCRWWHKGMTPGQTGYCHRRAPDIADRNLFPITDGTQWCGDWQGANTPRLAAFGYFRFGFTYRWLRADADELEWSQEFDTEGAAVEAEGLGLLEWTPLEKPHDAG